MLGSEHWCRANLCQFADLKFYSGVFYLTHHDNMSEDHVAKASMKIMQFGFGFTQASIHITQRYECTIKALAKTGIDWKEYRSVQHCRAWSSFNISDDYTNS